MSFWALYRIVPDFFNKLSPQVEVTPFLINVIQSINKNDWNNAKKVWVKDVIANDIEVTENSVCLFGSLNERVIRYVHDYQTYIIRQLCTFTCSIYRRVKIDEENSIYLKSVYRGLSQVFFNINDDEMCDECNQRIELSIEFIYKPPFLFLESFKPTLKIDRIPEIIEIEEIRYRYLCSSVHKSNHFKAIFKLFNNYYLIDDITQSMEQIDIRKKSESWSKMTLEWSLFYRVDF